LDGLGSKSGYGLSRRHRSRKRRRVSQAETEVPEGDLVQTIVGEPLGETLERRICRKLLASKRTGGLTSGKCLRKPRLELVHPAEITEHVLVSRPSVP